MDRNGSAAGLLVRFPRNNRRNPVRSSFKSAFSMHYISRLSAGTGKSRTRHEIQSLKFRSSLRLNWRYRSENRIFKASGLIVNEKISGTGGPVSSWCTEKFLHAIAVAILISSIASVRPGQNLGPDPNGTKA